MKRLLLTLLAGTLALTVSGCGAGPATSSEDEGAGAKTDTRPLAEYPALTPESEGEKKVAADIDDFYAMYLEGAENNLKKDPRTLIYRGGDKVEPKLIGYEVKSYSEQNENETWDMCSVMVLNGTVTSPTNWERAGDLTKTDFNPGYFVYELFEIVEEPIEPTTDREKQAVEKARAWVTANLPDLKMTRFDLVRYVFAYGDPGDEHWLVLHARPNGTTVYSNTK